MLDRFLKKKQIDVVMNKTRQRRFISNKDWNWNVSFCFIEMNSNFYIFFLLFVSRLNFFFVTKRLSLKLIKIHFDEISKSKIW